MGWITDDGLHEGYVVPEFRDGQRGRGITGGGISADKVIVEVDYFREPPYVTRAASEVIGWRVMCDCSTPENGGRLLPENERWQGELIARVASPQAEAIPARRVYADDSEVVDIQERADVGELVQEIWRDEHVLQADALRILKDTRTRAALANRDLERAIASARAVGLDTHLISDAAGLSPVAQLRRTPSTSLPKHSAQRATHRELRGLP